jgi:bifunctional non-homologous end joining protein LigD
MLIERLRKRLAADRANFIEPCLLSPAPKPPAGTNWIHEIKHDGFRLMARRDPVGIRLITRRGHDWSNRYPLVVEAVNLLNVRSCLIDGEVVCCDEKGVAAFQLLRHRRNEPRAFLYAFDLLELNGTDLRREPIEVRKATLASILRKSRHGVRLNEHLEHDCGLRCFSTPALGRLEGVGEDGGDRLRCRGGLSLFAHAFELRLLLLGHELAAFLVTLCEGLFPHRLCRELRTLLHGTLASFIAHRLVRRHDVLLFNVLTNDVEAPPNLHRPGPPPQTTHSGQSFRQRPPIR